MPDFISNRKGEVMKVFNEKDYSYAGIYHNLYAFYKNLGNQDKELVLVERARFNKNDGSSIYFDPLPNRLEVYARLIRECKTENTGTRRIPS